MPRRRALTEALLEGLLAFPVVEADLIRHWTLVQSDLPAVEVPGCCLHILGGRCAPARRWGAAVEGRILVGIKRVEHRSRHAGQPAEVADGSRADVDATQASEYRLHVAYAGRAAVEATGPSAKATKQMRVTDFAQLGRRACGGGHRGVSTFLEHLLASAAADRGKGKGVNRRSRAHAVGA